MWIVAWCSAAAIALQFVWITFTFGGEYATTAFTDLLGVPAAFTATFACLSTARRDGGRSRRAWIALALGTASWGIGESVWSYYEVILRAEAPFPGLADIGFLGLVPLGVVAMLAFPTAPRGVAARLRAIFDGLIIAGSVLFIFWASVLGPTITSGEGSLFLQIVGLAYPVGDLVMIAIVLYVLARARSSDRLAMALVGLGLLSISVADSAFLWMNINELWSAGSYVDPFWNIGFFLIAIGALRRPSFDHEVEDDRRTGPWAIGAPYIPFAVAMVMAIIVQLTRGALEPFLFFNSVIVITFVVVRQLLALFDNLSLNRDLESRVADRTAELNQALVDLEESHRLQDEFVANTTHELLTPLTVIMASLETIGATGEELSPGVTPMIEMSSRAASKMKRQVEDVLLASGVIQRAECAREAFDVEQALGRTIERFTSTDKKVRAAIRTPVLAIGDEKRFGTVIQHLLSNADKFAPPHTTIEVDAYEQDGSVHICVADEGPGIDAEHREAVFKRFYQADGTSTRQHGGMGLGLFLARQLTLWMGGEIEIDDVARGTRMRVTLPTARNASETGVGLHVVSGGGSHSAASF